MEAELESPRHDSGDTRTSFRKPVNDAANRKYRRRSQVNDGSSSSDASPEHNRSCSPNHSRGNITKVSEPNHAWKDNRMELERDSGRSRHGRGGDSYRHDHFSREVRHDKGRKHRSSPSRSSRDSRNFHHSDHRRVDTEHSRSRGDLDRRSRDKFRSRDCEKGEDQSSRTASGRRHTETRSEEKDTRRDGKKEYENSDISKEDSRFKYPRDRLEDKSSLASENPDNPSKKLKGFISQKFTEADEKQTSSSKSAIAGDKELTGQPQSKEPGMFGDIDAAKVAAMKAAELVNKNLVGTGYLTTDQKKKLLWGNKKSVAAEEPAHHWDNALAGDRERQEKFNKLMGVKGNIKQEKNQNEEEVRAEKQKELQMDLEKQYTAGLRRRDGRTVGLGL